MDFTENCEFFSRSWYVIFNFHTVNFNIHSWCETNHAVNDQWKLSCHEIRGKISLRQIGSANNNNGVKLIRLFRNQSHHDNNLL